MIGRIILGAILFTSALYLAASTFKFKGIDKTFLDAILEKYNITVSPSTKTEVGEWIKSFPISEIGKMLFEGVNGVVTWLSRGFNILATNIIKAFNPNATIPSWFGYLLSLLIIAGVIWWQWNNLWDLMHTVVFWVIVGILVIVFIGIFLTMSGFLK